MKRALEHRAVSKSSCAAFCALCLVLVVTGCGSGSYAPPPDTVAPSAPASLTATAASDTQINLSWMASSDNVAVTGYKVERCQGPSCSSFAQIATPTTTTFNDTGLTPATAYTYRVRATDAAANLSSFSANSTATSAADATAPSAPTSLMATAASSTQINLSWTASTDDVGVTGYKVERCSGPACSNFSQIAPSTTTTFSNTGLTPSTSYSYRVRATDAAGNLSGYSNTVAAATQAASAINVSISPKRAAVTTSQPQQFNAVVTGTGTTTVNWSVDGTGGGTASSGTIDATGHYTPGAGTTPGVHIVSAASTVDATATASVNIAVTDIAGVFTHQNDNQRTGQNLREYALTPATVNAASFGQRFSCSTSEGGTVPGHIYAQPLYVANLTMSDAKMHNVVFVATESDFVYAFDADVSPCKTYWKASMLDPIHGAILGETTVPACDTGECDDLHPEIGITSTPVIDAAINTIYLTSKTKESSTAYHHRLHALDLVTGIEKNGSPVEVAATGFTPLIHMQRPALLLNGNSVYLAFGSHGDQSTYHGWLMGYNKTTLAQNFVWSATDLSVGTSKGAIWQAGAGPALDASGNIWVETANGDFDGTFSFGDSVVKINPAAMSPVVDYFAPRDQSTLDAADIDLGSGGVTILPDGLGNATHPHLALATGKTNLLYLLDQNNLGHFNLVNDNIVQEVTLHNGLNEANITGGMFAKAAYFNGRIYVLPIQDVLRAFTVSNAQLTPLVATGADTFGFPGATPAISAQGSTSGIVWVLNTTNNNSVNGSGTIGPAQLFAYDAGTLSKLFSSPTSGNAVKFCVPTVANGKVYVGTQSELDVYGLLP
jgi:chitodextrinase